MEVELLFTGTAPLLMHNPAGMLVPKPPTRSKPDPVEEAKASRYLVPESDVLGVPATAVRKCLVAGAKGVKDEKTKRAAGPVILAYSCPLPGPEAILPLSRGGELITEHGTDVRTVVVMRRRIVRARARIELPWELRFTLRYDEDMLGEEFPQRILVPLVFPKAGTGVGLLDYRPEKSGWFGTFSASVVR